MKIIKDSYFDEFESKFRCYSVTHKGNYNFSILRGFKPNASIYDIFDSYLNYMII